MITKQVWKIGDCLELLQDVSNHSINLILTDPPYFLPINSYVGTRKNGYNKRTLADTSILKGYFERVFQELDRVLSIDGTFYIFCDAQSYPIFYQAMFPYCNHVRLLIWDKIISYNGYTWRHQHELIAWGERTNTKRIPTGDGDILKCRGVLQEDRNHPAEKPIELLQKLILKHGDIGDTILDPYVGSGSTLVACSLSERNGMGFELDPQYEPIIEKRLKFKATKLETWASKGGVA